MTFNKTLMMKPVSPNDMFQIIKSVVPSKNAVSANKKIVDTSLKHPISSQSTTVVKGCMVDTAFCYGTALVIC